MHVRSLAVRTKTAHSPFVSHPFFFHSLFLSFSSINYFRYISLTHKQNRKRLPNQISLVERPFLSREITSSFLSPLFSFFIPTHTTASFHSLYSLHSVGGTPTRNRRDLAPVGGLQSVSDIIALIWLDPLGLLVQLGDLIGSSG
jgi:hypothetical protein